MADQDDKAAVATLPVTAKRGVRGEVFELRSGGEFCFLNACYCDTVGVEELEDVISVRRCVRG